MIVGRPFRLLHYSYSDETLDDPEARAAHEQGFALWPLDLRTSADLRGNLEIEETPGWPDHVARYGLGPCIVVHYGPQVGAAWSVHTARGQNGASADDITQFHYGLIIAAALVKELESDPSRPARDILFATSSHAPPLSVREVATEGIEGPVEEDERRDV